MPITVHCKCGKRLRAPDSHAGKRALCPGCGEELQVPLPVQSLDSLPLADAQPPRPAARRGPPPLPASAPALPATPLPSPPPIAPPPAAAPAGANQWTHRNFAPRQQERMPLIHVSPKVIIISLLLLFVVGGILALKFGPARAAAQWKAMQDEAHYDTLDVLNRGIQGFYLQRGIEVRTWREPPKVQTLTLEEPTMAFVLPQKIVFNGSMIKLGQGNPFDHLVKGEYDTRTGEIEGEAMVAGTTIKITGRVKGNVTTAEVNGTSVEPLFAIPPATLPYDDADSGFGY